jgi:hypothetical protein
MEIQATGASPLITVTQKFLNDYLPEIFDEELFKRRLAEVIASERPEFTFANGIMLLIEKLKTDPDYYRAWQANMALAFQDTYFARSCMSPNHSESWMNETGNIAAAKFLDLLIK